MSQRPFDVPAELYPFDDHWFDYRGAPMHYVDQGEGLPVVLMHGNPTWSFLYRDIIKQLPDNRCIAPDYPGFGMSGTPNDYDFTMAAHVEAVSDWLDHLDLERFVMVVQDWGGPVGLSNAVRRADRVAGLVILNTWAWPAKDWTTWAFAGFMGGPIGKQLILRRNLFAATLVPQSMSSRRDKSQAVFDAYTAPFPDRESRIPTWVFPREITRNDDRLTQLEQDLAKLRGKPTEMVWGMKDAAFGNEGVLRKWHKVLGDVPTTRIPKGNHYIQEDATDEIVAAIQRVAAAASSG